MVEESDNGYKIFDHFLTWLDAYKGLETDEVDDIYYPKKEQIISLHDYLIKNFKYSHETEVHKGVLYDAPLDFYSIKCYMEKLENKYEDLIHRGARLFNLFLEEGHPFIDGNKRTGFVTLWVFLTINNFNIRFEYFDFNSHIEKFKRWANSETDNNNIYEITLWIKENETFYQKFKRCFTENILKIKKLIFR